MVVFLVGAGVLAVVSIVGFLELVLNGSAEAIGAARRVLTGRASDRSFVRGVVRLALAVVVFSLPFRAVERAEEGSAWVDVDGNDLLDPHSDGPYTWAEVNGPDFVKGWAVGAGLVLVVAATTYRPSRWRMPTLRRRPAPASRPPKSRRSRSRPSAPAHGRRRRTPAVAPGPARPPDYDPIPAYGAHASRHPFTAPDPTPTPWPPPATPDPAPTPDAALWPPPQPIDPEPAPAPEPASWPASQPDAAPEPGPVADAGVPDPEGDSATGSEDSRSPEASAVSATPAPEPDPVAKGESGPRDEAEGEGENASGAASSAG